MKEYLLFEVQFDDRDSQDMGRYLFLADSFEDCLERVKKWIAWNIEQARAEKVKTKKERQDKEAYIETWQKDYNIGQVVFKESSIIQTDKL